MRNEATPKRLLLIGGTGLVGSMLLQRAATRPDLQLTSLTRRAGQGVAINFDAMLQSPETTILAAAPQAEYAVVEFDYFDGDIFRAVADSAATLRAMGVR